MKSTLFVTAFCTGVAVVASGQALAQTTQTTQTSTTETKSATADGVVVRYDPGHAIVIRGTDNKEVTYALPPSVTVPVEVTVGRRVTLFTEPGVDGTTQLVSRVTTTSVTPAGDVKRTTEDTRHLPSGAPGGGEFRTPRPRETNGGGFRRGRLCRAMALTARGPAQCSPQR